MIKEIFKITFFVSLLITAGCRADHVDLEDNAEGVLSAKFFMTRGADVGIDAINHIYAYRFYNGMLEEIFPALKLDESNIISLKPSEMKGNVYFMVNADNVIPVLGFETGVTTEEQFLSSEASTEEMMGNGFLMTGRTSIDEQTTTVEIGLKRALARIDISSPMKGIEVNKVILKGVCDRGYIIDSGVTGISDVKVIDIVKDYGMNPLSVAEETLFYLPHQENRNFEVEIIATHSGAWHRMKTVLPEILRNKKYTLNVYAEGSDLRVEVKDGEWLEGGGSVSDGLVNVSVDVDGSILEEGVIVSEGLDSVFIPSWKNRNRIVLRGESGATARIYGKVTGAEVILTESADGLCDIDVDSKHKMPGSIDEYLYVDAYRGDVHRGRIVLVFKANPIYIGGLVKINDQGICDFEDYIDGELAEIRVPEGKTVNLEFDNGTAEWMKLEQTATGVYRLLGGWRPNDPEADGRIQEGHIVISGPGNLHSETYTIKRRNWGLPVENINGTWWCKYNLRGNVKSFADQITVTTDPAHGGSVSDYMEHCTDDEFLDILGGQYQAGHEEAMNFVFDQELGFINENFSSRTDNFGTMDPKKMAPSGYEIPDFDDYRFFNWGGNSNLGYYNPGVFNNGLGQRLNFKVVERKAVFLGHEYGPVTFYDFEFEGKHLVLCGLGHQWNATNMTKMNILFATYGNSGSTWSIDGFSKNDGRGNWFKYVASNPQKTRTVRCIKSPVDYIY